MCLLVVVSLSAVLTALCQPEPIPEVAVSPEIDYESLTLMRMRQAERERLEREILEREANE